jgi:hypothetical protein
MNNGIHEIRVPLTQIHFPPEKIVSSNFNGDGQSEHNLKLESNRNVQKFHCVTPENLFLI